MQKPDITKGSVIEITGSLEAEYKYTGLCSTTRVLVRKSFYKIESAIFLGWSTRRGGEIRRFSTNSEDYFSNDYSCLLINHTEVVGIFSLCGKNQRYIPPIAVAIDQIYVPKNNSCV